MSRLTEAMRTSIVNALTEKATANDGMDGLKKTLAHNLLVMFLRRAPENWVRIVDYIYTTTNVYVRTPHNGSILLGFDEAVPVPKAMYSYGGVYLSQGDLSDNDAGILKQITDLLDEKATTRKLFRDIVQAATTDTKLVEMLPEAGPVIQEMYGGANGQSKALVPVEQVAAARALLKGAL